MYKKFINKDKVYLREEQTHFQSTIKNHSLRFAIRQGLKLTENFHIALLGAFVSREERRNEPPKFSFESGIQINFKL